MPASPLRALLIRLAFIGAIASVAACSDAGGGDVECAPFDRRCESEEADGSRPGPSRGDAGLDVPPSRDLGLGDDADVTVVEGACDPRSCEELDNVGLPRPDTDLDGIGDCVETSVDVDGDGVGNCEDDDSDGDGIPDIVEGGGDTDGDGRADFLDLDSDDDNILDQFEGTDDTDEDGVPNFRDLDSDADGWPDAAEYGHAPGADLPAVDRDGDREPDFLDLDSDGDGLADSEERGCPVSTDRTVWDTDDDGYNDLVEVAFGANACDPDDDISALVDFYFELPYAGPMQDDVLEFSTNVQHGDVVFNMDTTGSMGEEIVRLRNTLVGTIIPQLGSRLDNVAYGVTSFDDFPCDGFGSRGDTPFILHQRVTLSRGDAADAVAGLSTQSGGDFPESGFEALYQIATGEGRTGCSSTRVPAFDVADGYVAGVADGWVGGVGFREGALPMVVQITDAPAHARGEDGYNHGAGREQTYEALGAIGARVIGVASGSDARYDTLDMARRTGAVVPSCAWDGECGANQCCTGIGGDGRAAEAGDTCPLVFDIASNGSGLDTSIVAGIDALINFAPVDVSIVLRSDPETPEVDTTCFLKAVRPDSSVSRDGACATTPTPTDFNRDGEMDGFSNVTPGTQLLFQVEAENDTCVRGTRQPQVFLAYIDVVADGVSVLDTQLVTILVPPDLKQ